MICLVAADASSTYVPSPSLTFKWDPDAPSRTRRRRKLTGTSFDLAPHPADPHSTVVHPVVNDRTEFGPNAQSKQVFGQEIWMYAGNGGYIMVTFSFAFLPS
jgi:hypothetical protein